MNETDILQKLRQIISKGKDKVLIIIGGAPGAGKTTLAKKIADFIVHKTRSLKIRHIDIDDKKEKELFLSTRGTDEQWPSYKWEVFHNKINESLQKNNITIATATFSRHTDRQYYEDLCNKSNIEFLGIWLEIDLLQSIKRQKYRAQSEGHIDPVDTIEERAKLWFEKYKDETSKDKFSIKWSMLKAK
ncbi:MAG: ATP-binding protein [Candidatus Dojkabacteria bacterium]|nr:ATP-binding protein [Candidatus Dojkabacteria bacterium]